MTVANQHEWVKLCQLKYQTESLPEGEHWEDAHYPLPDCLGGTETVKLWSRDHAVHGVLQSLDLNHPCVHGANQKSDTELILKYYPEYADMCEEVHKKQKTLGGKVQGQRNVESGHIRSVGKTYGRVAAENGQLDRIRTPESTAKGGVVAAKIQHAQRWECTETGYVTTPGPLSRWQKARGIDTKKRKRLC
jgi:hypothetical protein